MNENDILRLRTIPLESVLDLLGGKRDSQDPKRNWKTNVGRITVTGIQFYNHDLQYGGGGAIDLAMHLSGQTFKEIVGWLGKEVYEGCSVYVPSSEVKPHDKKRTSSIPKPNFTKLTQIKNYLVNQRAIPENLINDLVAKDKLWPDDYANAVFRLFNLQNKPVGVELRGTGIKPFHGIRGEKGFFSLGESNSKTVVFVESAIDAISYYTLYPEVLILSTTGSGRDMLNEAVKLFNCRGFKVISGFDNDEAGDRMAETLSDFSECFIERHKPMGCKDWNEQLILLKQK